MQTRPFLKWLGGKASSVAEISSHFPPDWSLGKRTYIEPFLGGGAVFFTLQPFHAILCDINTRLIRTYKGLRDYPTEVISRLQAHEAQHKQCGGVYYNEVRSNLNNLGDSYLNDFDFAADFIFLNKAGFNGLYRVNQKNEINVPWGKDKDRRICDEGNLRACSALLNSRSRLFADSAFDIALEHPDHIPGSIIYCDPPYVPVSKTANFTSYTPCGFTYQDQLHLLVKAIEWREHGAHVILSQAADESLIEQYVRCGFRAKILQSRRSINSKGSARGPVNEYLIY